MNARGQILKRIKSLALIESPLPSIPVYPKEIDLLFSFKQSIISNGSMVIEQEIQSVNSYLRDQYAKSLKCISFYNGFSGNVAIDEIESPHGLDEIEIAIITADFGVAENGAMWINPVGLMQPVLPFIVAHLVVVLDCNRLVATMHEAYEQLQLRDQGFGLFISGPSKTADIEQSLVIGAHGPLSLTVILI